MPYVPLMTAMVIMQLTAGNRILPWKDSMPPMSQAWFWVDEQLPPVDVAPSLSELYPFIGIIQLQMHSDASLEIDLVKRPSASRWPETSSFCTPMLPAAIERFFTENNLDIEKVESMEVWVRGAPYVAACKCYARTIISMGFSVFESVGDFIASPHLIPALCASEPQLLRARRAGGTLARIPPVSAHARRALEGADIVLNKF